MRRLVLTRVVPGKAGVRHVSFESVRVDIGIGTTAAYEAARESHLFHYWRMVGRDGHRNLTFELDQLTGELFGIELIGNPGVIQPLDRWSDTASESGVPAFDLSGWKRSAWIGVQGGADLFDLYEDFSVELRKGVLRLRLLGDNVSRYLWAGGESERGVIFEFNVRSELCGVVITGLSPDEQRLMERWS